MKIIVTFLLFTTLLFSMNNYNKGVKAYNEGQHKTAIALWMPYAMDHDANVQYLIATIYFDGKADVEQNYTKAMEWYEKSALDGNSKANLKIGLMYCEGKGVLTSFKKAVAYIQKAYKDNPDLASEIWKKYKLYDYE